MTTESRTALDSKIATVIKKVLLFQGNDLQHTVIVSAARYRLDIRPPRAHTSSFTLSRLCPGSGGETQRNSMVGRVNFLPDGGVADCATCPPNFCRVVG
jgi:hypothetical protein